MPKITELYCYIAEDEGPDDEGVAAYKLRDTWMPLWGADMARVDSLLRTLAQRIANQTGKPLRLVRFTQREELELVKPQ